MEAVKTEIEEIAGHAVTRYRLRDGSRIRSFMRAQCVANPEHVLEMNVTAKGGGPLPLEAALRKFANKGWLIGKRSATCPGCQGIKPHTHEAAEPQKEEAVTKPELTVVPRAEVTPHQRRTVMSLLQEHFLADRCRYADPRMDDVGVAAQSDVPVEVVVEIREQFFGPIKGDEFGEIIAGIKKAEDRMIERMLAAEQTFTDHCNRVTNAFNKAKQDYETAVTEAQEHWDKEVAEFKARIVRLDPVSAQEHNFT